MGELSAELRAQLPEVDEQPRTDTAPHDLGIKLRIQFELIAECYGIILSNDPKAADDNRYFAQWGADGHAEWFNDFINNDSETVALLQAGRIDEAKIRI